jgi:hypothetical protein
MLYLLIFLSSAITNAMIISEPGQYVIGQDIISFGTDVVTITTSNVNLNLGNRALLGGNNGIVIDSGLTNISISDGYIANVLGSGIIVGQDCSIINIKNMIFGYCAERAIDIQGSSTANNVRTVFFENITTFSSSFSPLATAVFNADFAHELYFKNCIFLNNGSSLPSIGIMRFNHCSECQVAGLQCNSNMGYAVTGIDLIHGENNIFLGCSFIDNVAAGSGGASIGVRLSGNALYNAFGNCLMLTNSAQEGNSFGFYLDYSSQKNIFQNCQIGSLYSYDNAIGFLVTGSGVPSNTFDNIFVNIDLANMFALTGSSLGWFIDNADNCSIESAQVAYLQSNSLVSAAIMFSDPVGGSEWHVRNSSFVHNKGFNDANSYGVFVQTGTNNFFVKNYASNNGIIPANQFNGVPINSVSQVTLDNLNTVFSPFTNLAVTI